MHTVCASEARNINFPLNISFPLTLSCGLGWRGFRRGGGPADFSLGNWREGEGELEIVMNMENKSHKLAFVLPFGVGFAMCICG